MKKIFIFTLLIGVFFQFNYSFSEVPHYIDFSKVLNNSVAGAKAQKFLKEKFSLESAKFSKMEKDLLKKESELIAKKKIITSDEFKKNITGLRTQVKKMQEEKRKSVENISTLKKSARKQLYKALNPIIQNYMTKNKIRVVLDKKGIILADKNLEITDQVIELLNKQVKSLKLK